MTRRAFALTVGGIALVALAIRVGYVLALGAHPPLGFDGTWYSLQAGTIADGIGYVDPRSFYASGRAVPTAQFPPLWPGFLALVNFLGFESLRSYRIAGGLVGAVTVVLTGYIGRGLVGARVGVAAAVIVAVSPFMIAADASLMAESLFVALVTGAVLVAVRAGSKAGFGTFALLGLLLGLATLTRSDGILVAVVLVGVTAWCAAGSWGRRLGFAGVAVLVAVATLVPWTVRNTDAMGEAVVLSSNSGGLLAGANCPAAYGGRDIGGWSAQCAAAAEPPGATEVERAAAGRSAGVRYARDHVPRLLAVAPIRVLRGWGLWSPSVLADSEVIESRNRTMQLAAWPVSLVLLGVAAAGGVILVRRRARVGPLFAVIGGATLVLVASWGDQRFRVVADPELAVLAAAALVTLWARIRPAQNFPVRP